MAKVTRSSVSGKFVGKKAAKQNPGTTTVETVGYTDEKLREMIVALLGEADYDMAKFFDPEVSEDPEEAEIQMKTLIKIARKHLKR